MTFLFHSEIFKHPCLYSSLYFILYPSVYPISKEALLLGATLRFLSPPLVDNPFSQLLPQQYFQRSIQPHLHHLLRLDMYNYNFVILGPQPRFKDALIDSALLILQKSY